jgi:acyl carrier protein
MSQEQIINQLNQILIDEFEVDQDVIELNANVKETLDLDSLDYVDLVVLIESNFGVKLVEADFKSMITFKDFYAIIENKIATK